MRYAKLSLLWLVAALLITPVAWSLLASFVSMVLIAPPTDYSLRLFIAGFLYLVLFGAAVTAVLAVPYAAALLAWPWFVDRVPRVEQSASGLLVATACLSLPGALAVGLSSAEFAGTYRLREFLISFPPALCAGWLGLLGPRLLFSSLAPRAFRSPGRAAA